jgi:aminopeptidase C
VRNDRIAVIAQCQNTIEKVGRIPRGLIPYAIMTQASLTRSLKQALAASLRDHRDDFRDLLAEVIEDVALASAIRDGEKSKPVKRESVMKALRDTK